MRVDLDLHVAGCTTAGTWGEGVPVGIADDGGTLGSTIADGVGKVNALEELFHFLIEGSTTDDDFVHLASESLEHFLTDHLAHTL